MFLLVTLSREEGIVSPIHEEGIRWILETLAQFDQDEHGCASKLRAWGALQVSSRAPVRRDAVNDGARGRRDRT